MQNTFFRWNISKSRLLNGPRTPSTMSCPHCHLAQYTIDLNVCCKQKYQLLDVHSISISPPVHTTINIQQKTLVQQTLYAKNFWDTNEMKKSAQRRHKHCTSCSKVEPKYFAPPQIPFPAGLAFYPG